MAHTLGTTSTRTSLATNPITTASFTLVREDTVLCLLLKVNGATDRAGGAPTFSSLTFTQASTTQKAAASPEASCELWYILNPCHYIRPGSYTATIPNTGSLTVFYTFVTGRAKSGGSSKFDGANGGNGTSTNPTPGAVTCTEPGDIGFAVVASGAQTWAPTAQAGTAIANTDDGTHGGGEQYILQESIGAVTLGWTFGTSDDWGAVSAFFKEISPVNINNYLHGRAADGISMTEKIR